MNAINLAQKLTLFEDFWKPFIVAEVNDVQLKLVKLYGEFVWHHHENADELFMVIKGRLQIKFRDGDVWLNEGECLVIPRGVEHCTAAEAETHVLLMEPKNTLNTGNVQNERTVEAEWI